ncbi:head GIN domain-containing protein [Bacteroides sp.]
MKSILSSSFAVALLILVMTACSPSNRITGSNNYITKKIKIERFEGLQLTGSPDVIYKQTNGKPSVEVYGQDNVVDLLDIHVQDNCLVVKFKDNTSIQNRGKLEVRVSGPALNRISLSGSGDIKLANGIQTDENIAIKIQGSGDIDGNKIGCHLLSLSINGSGDITLNKIKASTAEADINGSGDIALSGICQKAKYSINGSGDIQASELKAEDVSASINGSGDISCHATERLKGRVSGSGEVAYKGEPQIDFSKKGLRKL